MPLDPNPYLGIDAGGFLRIDAGGYLHLDMPDAPPYPGGGGPKVTAPLVSVDQVSFPFVTNPIQEIFNSILEEQ